ncbi:protein kinase, partial [Pyxidicoccus fallax]
MNESTAVSDTRIGSVLQERYRIIERLAAGGMGVVYRGERLEVGKPVAIKFLHAWAARDEDFRKRFQVEARAMSRLTHPCCVSVIDFGVDEDSPYMVMDFVTGETLRGLLRDGALPLARAVGTVRQVLAGLAHAHAQGIIHRDIKPENIIVTQAVGLGEQVRILDFGIAKLRDEATGLTSGLMLGTPSYMAPEQIHGEPVGPPTDVYATGVLLFEVLTGKKPFASASNAELLHMHREVKPPALRDVAPEAGFSDALEAAVAKALAKAPADRFQSATEFLAALDAAVSASAGVSPRQDTAASLPLETPARQSAPEAPGATDTTPARPAATRPRQDAPGAAHTTPARPHETPARQSAPEAPGSTDTTPARPHAARATPDASGAAGAEAACPYLGSLRENMPAAPGAGDSAPAQQREALATEGAPAEPKAPAATSASSEVVASSSRNEPTMLVPKKVSGTSPASRSRSLALVGGATALVLVGA